MTDEDSSRLRIVQIRYGSLACLLAGKVEIVEGIPDDARIDQIFEEPHLRMVKIRVWSMEFAPVPDGGLIPEFDVKVRLKRLL